MAEVESRRLRFGYNDIVFAPPSSWRDLLKDTAGDPMIWFLVGVGSLFAVLGDFTEAMILAAALVPLAGMDAWLHRRTQASTRGLASRLAARAVVIRDGSASVLAARELVPGDVVEISAGEAVPADGLLLSGQELQFDESSLTGEAYAVRKQPLPEDPSTMRSADLIHWGFAGTRLLTGVARMRVVTTGGETLYGEIVRSALAGRHELTPLQRAVGRLVAVMLAAAVVLCLLLGVVRLVQGHGLVDAFLSAVTLAVAALPEEFPVVLTFFLGVGVYRLAHRQALVRRAVAVENIGRITCICSDKTGTLTEGRLILAHSYPVDGVSEAGLLRWALRAARSETGDPMDLAIIAAASSSPAQPLASFPFTEARRRETAIVALPEGGRAAVVKGAPETVFAMCAASPAAVAEWRCQAESFAAGGHKVIAVAACPLRADADISSEPMEGFALKGMLAFEDPVRAGVRDAVTECRQAGIRVIMITGDHPATAEAIGRDIGLGDGHPVVALAEEIDDGGSGAGREWLKGVDVIARAAPSEKLRLVQALQRSGELVAVTGDGVNDVPALQAADIGIAMGERGTQSAREVAAVVLLDDNFRTVVRAVAEGRQLFLNLRLAFAYLLLIHIPFVLSAAAIPLADNPLLYLPVHIVWLELIIHPTALLVFQDRPSSGKLAPVRVSKSLHFFSARAWLAIGVTGLVVAAAISLGFEYALGAAGDAEHARSLAIGMLVLASAAFTAVLGGTASWTSRLIIAAKITSLLVLVQTPVVSGLIHLRSLHLVDWSLVAAVGVAAGLLSLLVRATLVREH